MAIKQQSSFSLVFLAPPSLLFLLLLAAGQAQATIIKHDLCESADYKRLCRSTLHGIKKPSEAIEAGIRNVIHKTRHAIFLSREMGNSENNDICKEMYDDVISDLEESIQNLKNGDKNTLNTNLSAAISYFSTCDDAFAEMDEVSPLTRANTVLEHMVDNTLSLVPLMHN
ncbi:uncharacterized protein LOC8273479 [Ricinus communis]|uniref:uncharacterized protein LOC8273479 n=1 Tax=Ricinus communis TaxID=3988 RepID=UPI00201A3063|nr:uncharacterized protein LOC8273479 [Ricinus communis]